MLLAHAMTSISGGVCWATIDSLHGTKVEHFESTYALALSTGANVGFHLHSFTTPTSAAPLNERSL